MYFPLRILSDHRSPIGFLGGRQIGQEINVSWECPQLAISGSWGINNPAPLVPRGTCFPLFWRISRRRNGVATTSFFISASFSVSHLPSPFLMLPSETNSSPAPMPTSQFTFEGAWTETSTVLIHWQKSPVTSHGYFTATGHAVAG